MTSGDLDTGGNDCATAADPARTLTMTENFEHTFATWIAEAVATGLPPEVKALSFNLYEPAGEPGVRFGVELIGADRFDEADPDWACDEVWEASPRGISIPEQYSGDTWERCLEKMVDLVRRQVGENSTIATAVRTVQGVAVGFVDGDLELVWNGSLQRPYTA